MSQNYKVLARAYRPQHFGELIGQDVLVRTLTNAINTNRVAQAYMLTGVRGVGKTTTARIIAKSLNYTNGPTAGPTDDDPLCAAITAGNHPDVLEMDAASNTQVDKMRDLLEGVQYAPLEARYKVYIIDEVHMLSTAAFNALLKTLEEPPSHVIFIFATTEIRKVPVTILSRCQRFDLKKVPAELLASHMKDICAKEKAPIDDDALALMARAADGSVRDSLSLLDRAIALAAGEMVTAALVKDMLGLSDQRAVFDLWALAVTGATADALAKSDQMRRDGADPARLAMDLCDLTHRACRVKVAAAMGDDQLTMNEIVTPMSLAAINRAWSLCLQGVREVAQAPDPAAAFDLTLVRLAYAATLPDPGKLIKALYAEQSGQSISHAQSPAPSGGGGGMMRVAGGNTIHSHAQPQSLEDIVALAQAHNDPRLAAELRQNVKLYALRAGVLEIALTPFAMADLPQRLSQFMLDVTGTRWMVSIRKDEANEAAMTLAHQESARLRQLRKEVLDNSLVRDIMSLFPGAEIIDILEKEQ